MLIPVVKTAIGDRSFIIIAKQRSAIAHVIIIAKTAAAIRDRSCIITGKTAISDRSFIYVVFHRFEYMQLFLAQGDSSELVC